MHFNTCYIAKLKIKLKLFYDSDEKQKLQRKTEWTANYKSKPQFVNKKEAVI